LATAFPAEVLTLCYCLQSAKYRLWTHCHDLFWPTLTRYEHVEIIL